MDGLLSERSARVLFSASWGMFVTCRVQGRAGALLAGFKIVVPGFAESLFLGYGFLQPFIAVA